MAGGGIKDLIPLLLQIDESKRQERQVQVQENQLAVMQKNQQTQVLNDFAKQLETVRDPVQLTAFKDFYSQNFGIDHKALDDFTANYLPTLAAQRAGASYSGTSAMSPEARGAYNTAAAFQNIIGQGQGAVAVDQNIAGDAKKVEKAAGVQAGTDITAAQGNQFTQNLMQMQLQRDIAQSGQQIDIRGQNLQNLMSSRNYALGLLPYEMAKAGAGGAGTGFAKPEDQMKYLLDLIQEQNKGGSKLTQQLLDALIRKNASGLFPNVPQSGTFAPGLWDRLTR